MYSEAEKIVAKVTILPKSENESYGARGTGYTREGDPVANGDMRKGTYEEGDVVEFLHQ